MSFFDSIIMVDGLKPVMEDNFSPAIQFYPIQDCEYHPAFEELLTDIKEQPPQSTPAIREALVTAIEANTATQNEYESEIAALQARLTELEKGAVVVSQGTVVSAPAPVNSLDSFLEHPLAQLLKG